MCHQSSEGPTGVPAAVLSKKHDGLYEIGTLKTGPPTTMRSIPTRHAQTSYCWSMTHKFSRIGFRSLCCLLERIQVKNMTTQMLLCGLQCYMKEKKESQFNIFSTEIRAFKQLMTTLDSLYCDLRDEGVGATSQPTQLLCH